MKKQIKLITAATAALVITGNAATMSVSNLAPTVDGADQNNYAAQQNKHKFWAETSGAGLTRGQRFTTGADDVELTSFSFIVGDNTQATTTKTYNVRVGSVTEALGSYAFSSLLDETATQSSFWGTSISAGVVNDGETAAAWATFTFAAPITLSANTEYGIDLGMASTTGSWRSGIPYLSYSADSATGSMFSSGVTASDPGTGDGSMSVDGSGRDMLFHLDMAVAVPEPSSTALLGLGGLALILRRRR